MPDYGELSQEVVNGNEARVKELTQTMLTAGNNPLDIIKKGLIAGMDIVGPLFKSGEMFVPEVLMTARAMGAGIGIVKAQLSDQDMPSIGKVAIGTVKGDLHDIGKNLVAMMLESAGFTVIDLGIDLPADTFVQAVKEQGVQIVAMSALLTTTMLHMKDTIDMLKEEGLREQVKIVIGGAPISQAFSDDIGADGFAADGASAVDLCKTLIGA
jgi:5-methyltetrahydrofolate--homocysteine methyltransferase